MTKLSRIMDFLARTPTLIVAFVTMNAAGAGFGAVQQHIGGELLDMIADGGKALNRLTEMSADQKSNHLIATLTLDTLYPLAYGAFLGGIAWRVPSGKWRWLIVPALCGVALDFIENGIQVLVLSGQHGLLAAKAIVTPLKFTCVIAAMAIALILLLMSTAKFLKVAVRGTKGNQPNG